MNKGIFLALSLTANVVAGADRLETSNDALSYAKTIVILSTVGSERELITRFFGLGNEELLTFEERLLAERTIEEIILRIQQANPMMTLVAQE